MSQLSFLSIAQNNKKLKCERFLDQMDKAVPWDKLTELIRPYFRKASTGASVKTWRQCSEFLVFNSGLTFLILE